MTTKTKTETERTVPLTAAQQRHVLQLVSALDAANSQVEKAAALQDAAKEKFTALQVQANQFIAYCAEENGAGDLTFSQERMAFVPRATGAADEGGDA